MLSVEMVTVKVAGAALVAGVAAHGSIGGKS